MSSKRKVTLTGNMCVVRNYAVLRKTSVAYNYWNHITFRWRWFIAFRPCRLITTHLKIPIGHPVLFTTFIFFILNTIWILTIIVKEEFESKNHNIFKKHFIVKVELGLLNRKMPPKFKVTSCNNTDPST